MTWGDVHAGAVEAPEDLTGRDHGFTTNWGPVGFRKSGHPLSIMVCVRVCVFVCVCESVCVCVCV